MTTFETMVDTLGAIPPQIATLILAMLPFGELRASLPVALTIYHLPLWEALFWSILGNMIPVWGLLAFFEQGSRWLRTKSLIADALFDILFERVQKKLKSQVEKYGVLALIIFVGIPLPATGIWNGALAAFVFGMSRTKAFIAILFGVSIAAAIMTIVTLGATFTIRSFF